MRDHMELVHEAASAYAERGPNGLAEWWHPDVVYEEDPLWPGAQSFHGRTAVLARFREYEEQLGRARFVVDRVVERPDGYTVVYQASGVTPGAGVPFEHRWAWVVALRDEKAIHIRAYFDPGEALRETGIEK